VADGFSGRHHPDGQVLGQFSGGKPVGPFDNEDGVRIDHILKADAFEFGCPGQAVEIGVKEGDPARIIVDKGIGGAGHRIIPVYIQPPGQSLNKDRFPGPQVPGQGNGEFPGNGEADEFA